MATTTQHIAARTDQDLLARFVAAAEQAGMSNASSWVQSHMGQLVTQVVESNQTISDVYAYASTVRQQHIDATPDRPGENLSAVTDSFLASAITAVQAAEAG